MYSGVISYAQSVIILFQIQINELCLRVLCIFVIKAKALIYFCLPFYLLTRAKKINFLKSLGSFKGQICVARITKYTGKNYGDAREKRVPERKIDGRKESGNFRRNSAPRPFGCLYSVLTLAALSSRGRSLLFAPLRTVVRFYFILPGLRSYDPAALERIESGNCEIPARSLLIKSDEKADISHVKTRFDILHGNTRNCWL